MNKNINNDINRFDGKYLKCVVSKYNSVLKYLANSGAMVILQPTGDEKTYGKDNTPYQRNYIYLGDEFLASGYGFLCKDMRDKAEDIIIKYESDIKALQEADVKEAKLRNERDTEIEEKLNQFVKIKGGPIENTVFRINNISIPTKDIILYGEEAQYRDLSIESIAINISWNLGDNNAYNGVSIYNTGISNDMSLNKTIYLPIGSQIKKINCKIVANDNDSGGLSQFEILHDFKNMDEDKYEAIVINYDFDGDTYIEDPYEENVDDADKIFRLHQYIYSKYFNFNENGNNVLIVDREIDDIIKGIIFKIKETPVEKYKLYPALYAKNNEYKIVSSGNIIKPHKLDLNVKINVKPQYYVISGYNLNSNDLSCLNNYSYYGLNDYDYELKTIIDIPLETSLYSPYMESDKIHIYFGVPSNFAIQNLYLIGGSEKYNLTGLCKVISKDALIKCPQSQEYKISEVINNVNTIVNKKCCIAYDFYELYINEPEPTITHLELELCYLNIINDVVPSDINSYNNLSLLDTPYYVNNETFNGLYWINGKDSDLIANKILNANKNGIKQ